MHITGKCRCSETNLLTDKADANASMLRRCYGSGLYCW